MRPKDVLCTAAQALKCNMSRACLTVLGLSIGVGACIAIGSLGTAAVQSVRVEMDRFGVDRIWIAEDVGNATRFSDKDVRALKAEGSAVTAMCYGAAKAHYGTRSKACAIVATTPEYASIENMTMESGRFLLPQDGQNILRAAVIEDILKEELFGAEDALGQKIRIGQSSFTVVGVIRTVSENYFATGDGRSKAYVPLETYRQLTGAQSYDEIVMRMGGKDVRAMAERVKAVLRTVHGSRDSFTVTSLSEQIASAERVIGIVTTVLIVVGVICMLTGGVGVMNVMLTGVRERRREIGIRKALGAKDSEIFAQFLCESALYGACGALFGTILGAVFTHLGQSIIGVGAQIVPWVTVSAIGFACAVGLVCGVYPAMRASAVSPVTAMRQM